MCIYIYIYVYMYICVCVHKYIGVHVQGSSHRGVFKSQATEAPLGPQPWRDDRYVVGLMAHFWGCIVVTSGMSYLQHRYLCILYIEII